MVDLDHRLVHLLSTLPAFDPGVTFEARVMAGVQLGTAPTSSAVSAPSPRSLAARRRVVIGSVITAGSVVGGFAWASAHPVTALGAVTPALRQAGEALWLTVQTVATNAAEQPWFGSARDLLASPGRALLAMVALGGLYALALTGFRRLLTEPAAHAHG